MKKRRVTINDIAQELNVSKTLVSMVLNGKGDDNAINKETQKKVLDKAKELNYKPNQVARGLRTGTTKTIGLIVADISNPFFARITRTIENYAEKAGYNIIVCSSDENDDKENALLRTLINRQVDGIIMSSTQQDTSKIEEIVSDRMPLVLFDRKFENAKYSSVTVDNCEATRSAIDHFVSNGHKNIGFITLAPSHISPLIDRKRGFIQAMEEQNLTIDSENILELGFYDLKDKQYYQIKDFIEKHQDLTAVFTANNSIVVGCMEAMNNLGRSIPEDLSIITFDDVELFKYTNPPLSSIAQPLEDIGKNSVSILLNQLKNDNTETQHIVLNTTLNIRQS
ncbi:MAG: LacI family transcriptional regulator [Salinivirgaceae bacterium]|nr:MAG: LacI family transcriptional regulator [Salinivirgaceae bacterium]